MVVGAKKGAMSMASTERRKGRRKAGAEKLARSGHAPRIFIASSSENLSFANALEVYLRKFATVDHWKEHFSMRPGWSYLQVLQDAVQSADWQKLIQATLDRFGSLDVLVNCHGAGVKITEIENLSDKDIQTILDWISAGAKDN